MTKISTHPKIPTPELSAAERLRRKMASVPQKNTSIEVRLAKALYKSGLRYRKHVKELPGTPDIVFTRAKIAIFVDGDFWHGYKFHSRKHKLKPFWLDKIETNRRRDARNFKALRTMGWRVIRVWEHDIKKDTEGCIERIHAAWSKRTSGKLPACTPEKRETDPVSAAD